LSLPLQGSRVNEQLHRAVTLLLLSTPGNQKGENSGIKYTKETPAGPVWHQSLPFQNSDATSGTRIRIFSCNNLIRFSIIAVQSLMSKSFGSTNSLFRYLSKCLTD
jgi:hypothetical protein